MSGGGVGGDVALGLKQVVIGLLLSPFPLVIKEEKCQKRGRSFSAISLTFSFKRRWKQKVSEAVRQVLKWSRDPTELQCVES